VFPGSAERHQGPGSGLALGNGAALMSAVASIDALNDVFQTTPFLISGRFYTRAIPF
jgi:hypothetical protein